MIKIKSKHIIIVTMNKNKQIVLENPFHPLDLSPHDLLAIYKRFEESRVINRNPKQELPIQIISQLISSLKGCPPSYIQKCISQALIKDTISWNEFLTFLDQQSEVREKILQWLMYQKTLIKYKLDKEWPIRAKINTFFEQITFLKFIELGDSDKLILCCTDNVHFYLLSEFNAKISIIDSYKNKSQRLQEQKSPKTEEDLQKVPSKVTIKNDSRLKKGNVLHRSYNKTEKKEIKHIEKTVNGILNSGPKISRDEEDEDTYFRKERKNINSLFSIWKDLNLEHSISYAKAVAPRISEKNINQTQIAQIKDVYTGVAEEKNEEKKTITGSFGIKPLDKAFTLLKDLHRQKRALSYNPYAAFRSSENSEWEVKQRKTNVKQRKERQYCHQSNKSIYNPKLRCLAIIYYNMQVVLLKLVKQFNKITLEQQDKIRIVTESEHKKNEIIEGIDFYYHSIVNKWYLIVLVRVEYKNEFRNQNQSYIRGYQIDLIDNKRRTDQDYRFHHKKEAFIFDISYKGKNKGELIKNEVFKMEMQMEYGIHLITVTGKYLCIREDYQQVNINKNSHKSSDDLYFRFQHEETFKNAGLSLSCLSVGVELNKIVFGTIRGMIIIYDIFSHFFKIKKITNSPITELKVVGSLVYILTLDQKLIILDLIKIEQVQHLSIKNQTKLHEKIKKFELNKNLIYFYGTEVKSYSQQINEPLQHEQRKMQTLYKWRLNKLFNENTNQPLQKYKDIEMQQLMPKNAIRDKHTNNIELVICSDSYFLALTEILELIVIDKKNIKIKFTMILSVPHDSKVMKMALSPNEKLIALLLFNQHIYVFNIHTQDQYQTIKPSPYLKYTSIAFLDLKNQYLLANGTENGKIMLSPYNSIPEKAPKILQFHKKSITTLVVIRKQFLVSCGEDYTVTIWLLPFNILKHEIKIGINLGYAIQTIGTYKQFLYLRALEGSIIEINTHEGKLVKAIEGVENWTSASIDAYTGQMFGTTKGSVLQKMVKEKQGWTKAQKYRIDTAKSEIKQLWLVNSEKAVVFLQNGMVLPWLYQGLKFGKPVNLFD